jgi:hypothetical protein
VPRSGMPPLLLHYVIKYMDNFTLLSRYLLTKKKENYLPLNNSHVLQYELLSAVRLQIMTDKKKPRNVTVSPTSG